MMDQNSMISLYDEEIIKIRDIVGKIEYKYKDAKGDFDVMWNMIVELEGRLHDAGFEADADWHVEEGAEFPQLVVNIIDRIDPISGFDHEKKQHEVKKAREKNEDIEEIH
jgi:hypothetical protein